MKKVPIFPLNLVMFPGAIYPLHIFEERYKTMINQCSSDDSEFGIVARIDSEIYHIGCLVKVASIYKIHDNGSMDILVKGTQRFRMYETSTHDAGFLVAEIEEFGDSESSPVDYKLTDDIVFHFRDILDKTNLQLDEKFWDILKRSRLKSFKIAEKSGMNLQQQQTFLSIQSEERRLKYLLNHFRELISYLSSSEALKEIIQNDGYLNEL
ncbi:MAG: LON peptidase substrate-binding domain-containing protein [Melioribacteraceae bacterium]|nr:LON peptidase substrate-binding domain-containing protein [Melioribacteraceae bacterium]MCF8263939.1 LON peptidase substrate-binding domain-containing protein [Melioribacteraceae bacterium]MCF8412304.1 LON peptidase substrate-binding domain-containing protein [Melioribacteraceae bacterium]